MSEFRPEAKDTLPVDPDHYNSTFKPVVYDVVSNGITADDLVYVTPVDL